MARSRRTPAMLIGRCSSKFSGHKTTNQINKVTSSDRSVPDFLHAALNKAAYAPLT